MLYIKQPKKIQILDRSEFVIEHILECGQIFSYKRDCDAWWVTSGDKIAKIIEKGEGYEVETNEVDYFEEFFDLKTDYSKIKQRLSQFEIMKKPIQFGQGIRILKQDLFETLISFIVSANNNIKRIKLVLENFKREFAEKQQKFLPFPTQKQLQSLTEEDFKRLGAGYRAKYLFNVLREVDESTLRSWRVLETNELKNKLIKLSGVGPKVADCVLLFGYGKQDVFPVDTWIAQMYNKFYKKEDNRTKIRENLIKEFGELSGYAQQYLFFSMREVII